MLNIRSFIEGKDEPIYVDIVNRAMAEFPDITPTTLEDAKIANNAPNTDKKGRFIAEWNNMPVGYVDAYLDLKRDDKIGFMDGPYVLPDFRRKKIGTHLLEFAISSYKERHIDKTQSLARSTNITAQKFLEKHEFKMHRIFSRMKRKLDEIPKNVGENREIKIVDVGTSDDALRLETNLLNEAMKEHFNFRPMTFEEDVYYTREQEKQGVKYNIFVGYLLNEPAGIMITMIDPHEIEHQKKNVAWLAVLGVLKLFRSKGIGKALMIYAMKYLKEQGMDEVILGVDDTNITKAIKIYESLGFEIILKSYWYLKEL